MSYLGSFGHCAFAWFVTRISWSVIREWPLPVLHSEFCIFPALPFGSPLNGCRTALSGHCLPNPHSAIRNPQSFSPFAHRYDLPHGRSRLGCEAIRGGRSSPRLARLTAWEEADRGSSASQDVPVIAQRVVVPLVRELRLQQDCRRLQPRASTRVVTIQP